MIGQLHLPAAAAPTALLKCKGKAEEFGWFLISANTSFLLLHPSDFTGGMHRFNPRPGLRLYPLQLVTEREHARAARREGMQLGHCEKIPKL